MMNDIYQTPDSRLTDGTNRDYKLYKVSGIALATFFGTVLAGGILMAKNYQRLGKPEQARKTVIFTVIATIAIIGIAALLPEDMNIPNSAFYIPQLIIMMQLAKTYQEADIKKHLEHEGEVFSNWRAFGVAVVVLFSMALVVGTAVALFLL